MNNKLKIMIKIQLKSKINIQGCNKKCCNNTEMKDW